MRIAPAVLFVVVSLAPAQIMADVDPPNNDNTPPEVAACKYRNQGDRCQIEGSGTTGTCRTSSCLNSGYEVACLKCVSTPDQIAKEDAGDSAGQPSTDDSGGCGCTTVRRSAAREVGAFLLAGSFALLFLLKNRKRRR
ncbi:MAG: hypothetical protein HY897_05135 [Deltaproteobacteria bacterium]|nr:hypothetical protein [Deltaproteobacteria bacterium]